MTIPAWISAGASVVGAGTSTVALVGVYKAVKATNETLKRERRRDELRDDADRREVAERVSVWVDPLKEEFYGRGDSYAYTHVNLVNVGVQPVFRVRISLHVTATGEELSFRQVPVLAPVQPGQRLAVVDDDIQGEAFWLEPRLSEGVSAGLQFEDSSGRQWRRSPDGRLVEMTEEASGG